MRFEELPYYGARVGRAKAEKGWLSNEESDRFSRQEFQDFLNAQHQATRYPTADFRSADFYPNYYVLGRRLGFKKLIVILIALYLLFHFLLHSI